MKWGLHGSATLATGEHPHVAFQVSCSWMLILLDQGSILFIQHQMPAAQPQPGGVDVMQVKP